MPHINSYLNKEHIQNHSSDFVLARYMLHVIDLLIEKGLITQKEIDEYIEKIKIMDKLTGE